MLEPRSAFIRVGQTLDLNLRYCDVDVSGGVSVLTYCAQGGGATAGLRLGTWRINQYDVPQVPSDLGTLAPGNASALYTAPPQVPQANPVAVSAQLTDGTTPTEVTRLVSNITIGDGGYIAYSEVRVVDESPLVGRVETSSTASGPWIYSPTKSQPQMNNTTTYVRSGHMNVSLRASYVDGCTVQARGGADFGDDGVSALIVVPLGPDTGKLSGGGSVARITVTGTQSCPDSGERPFTLTLGWDWFNSSFENPQTATIAPDAKGVLSGYNREVQNERTTEQSFKFVPVPK